MLLHELLFLAHSNDVVSLPTCTRTLHVEIWQCWLLKVSHSSIGVRCHDCFCIISRIGGCRAAAWQFSTKQATSSRN